MNDYLAIRNWKRFQHYKDRRPPWIKFYVDWLEDYELAGLPVATRLLACHLLLVAAKQENKIPADAAWIAKRVSMTTGQVEKGVSELLAIRYLRASKTLAERKPSRARERQKDSRGEKDLALRESRTESNGNGQGFEIPELRSVS